MKVFVSRMAKLAPLVLLGACVSTAEVGDPAQPASSVVSSSAANSLAQKNALAQKLDGAAIKKLQSGYASYYRHGRRTANGEAFDPHGMTAAHRTLPFGTRVRVVHQGTGREVIVRINDRGPFIHDRVIDLAQGAASRLGLLRSGVAPVSIYAMN